MSGNKVLILFLSINYVLFAFFQSRGENVLAEIFICFILPIIALGYWSLIVKKTIWFSLFLIFCSITDITHFLQLINFFLLPKGIDYYLLSALNILAYVCLTIDIAKNLVLKELVKHHKLTSLILLGLNIYITIELTNVIAPHLHINSWVGFFDVLFTIAMLSILFFAVLNYFNNSCRKSFYLLIGAISILISEVLHVACDYVFFKEKYVLNVIMGAIYLIGYMFFYEQCKLHYEKAERI